MLSRSLMAALAWWRHLVLGWGREQGTAVPSADLAPCSLGGSVGSSPRTRPGGDRGQCIDSVWSGWDTDGAPGLRAWSLSRRSSMCPACPPGLGEQCSRRGPRVGRAASAPPGALWCVLLWWHEAAVQPGRRNRGRRHHPIE